MPINSPFNPAHIPSLDIWDFIFESNLRDFPVEKPIYIDARTKQQYAWSMTKCTALDFGAGLQKLWGWQKGDVLGIFSPNCIEYPAIVLGAIWAGATVSPANPAYTAEELSFQLIDSGARALVTRVAYLEAATRAAQMAGIPSDRVLLIGDELHLTGAFNHFSSYYNMRSKFPEVRKPPIDPKKDICLLAYSSGTTGRPKAVMLTHENLVANQLQIQATDEGNLASTGGHDNNGDKIMAVVPYYHVYGFSLLILMPVYRGLTTVVMNKFELQGFLNAVELFRSTYALLVPPIILQLAKSAIVDASDISSLKMLMCGAAPLTQELIDELYRKRKLPVRQVYGLSETSPVALVQRWTDCRNHPGSVGNLLPNMSARVCDPEGQEVGPGLTGELFLRGPNVFDGYYGNPTATSECLDGNGWLRTGDIGHVDQNGNFYITDRAKELIKYNGFQVAPAELEGALLDHPSIMDVAVIGILSENRVSELPRAYVVLVPGAPKTKDEAQNIVVWLARRVAPHKQLRGGVCFIDEIPRNPSGKILRRVLRAHLGKTEPMNETRALKL